VRNSRSQRAIDRGSRFGQAAAEDAWKSAEVDALYKLHAADVRVPSPVMFLDGVLLMELVLDTHGDAAPRLIDVRLSAEEAARTYDDMITQLVRTLSCDLIHGDLSPYNVLWGAAGPTIIDFPQIVSASHNSRSEFYFLRDARSILGHLARIDGRLHARSGDPAEIWRAYMRRELSPDFRPAARPRSRAPRPQDPRTPPGGPRASRPTGRNASPPNTPTQHNAPRQPNTLPQHNPARHPNVSSQQGAPPRGARPPFSGGSRRPAPRAPEVIVQIRRSPVGAAGQGHPPPAPERATGDSQSEDANAGATQRRRAR
jgi:RIO kinase 1